MYKGIIDTSVILRFLTGDAPDKSKKFKGLIARATEEKTTLLVPLIVIVELVYVLEKLYKLEKADIREKAESLLSLAPIHVETEDLVLESLRLYEEENMKFGEAMLLARSRLSGIKPIYTFDNKDFKRFSEAVLL